jgi:hypothetical protein
MSKQNATRKTQLSLNQWKGVELGLRDEYRKNEAITDKTMQGPELESFLKDRWSQCL